MTSTLSQADVARLLSEPSPHVRAELAGKMAVELDNPHLTDSELRLAQDIVQTLARDVENSVRQTLAENVRKAARLPHNVAVQLANDIESVALPILKESSVLTEDDLITLVRGGAAAKQEAIAARPNVTEKISGALIETASESAVATLMKNNGAQISEASMGKAMDRFAASDTVKENMVKRAALPPAVAERLVTMVSENLKDYLVTHHEFSPVMATNLVLQSRERAVINLSVRSTEAELEKMITQMHASKRLTASIVLRALCMGDMPFFEMAMAVMANVPVVNARILIHDAGRLGLKSLYAKTGMPARFLPAVRVAIDVVHETTLDGGTHDRERYQARIIERVLTQFEDFGAEDLDYLLDKLGDVLTVAA